MINKVLKKIHIISKLHRQRLIEFIRDEALPGKTLDIGANFYNKHHYHQFFEEVVTFNIKPEKNIEIDIFGDAHQLPMKDNSFDNILCTEVLEHLHSPRIAIAAMRRVLKPGGKLILSTPFLMPLHDVPEDYYRFTPYGLRELFKDFEDVIITPSSTTFETFHYLAQRIVFQTDWGIWRWLKVPYLLLTKFLTLLQSVIKKEYGDISRTKEVDTIMSSGFFVAARKPE